MRTARKCTQRDATIINSIATHGLAFYLDPDGRAYLRNGEPISRYRFRRLLDLDLVEPLDQSLFGAASQSYGVKHARAETP